MARAVERTIRGGSRVKGANLVAPPVRSRIERMRPQIPVVRAALILAPVLLEAQTLSIRPAHGQTVLCGTVPLGTYTTGFNCAPASGIPATIGTSSITQITTVTGAGVRAAAQNADATISVVGTSITSNVAALANGVHAQVTNGIGNANVTFSGTNNILMGVGGDYGLFVQNNTPGSSSILVGSGVGLNIANNNSTGTERDGVEINSSGSGNATIIDNGVGSINVANGNGFWIKSANGGSVRAEAGSGVSFNINKPSAGGNNAGIHTHVAGSGDTVIVNGAAIQSSGDNAFGIYTQAESGGIAIANAGAIRTSGVNGFGIRSATSAIGDIAVSNAGAITTTGAGGHGIYLNSQGGTISVDNNAPISVGSLSATEGSRGIYINAFVAGNINVVGSGDITVLGGLSTPRGHAIILNATTGDISVNYSGNLTSFGNGAGGIRADAILGTPWSTTMVTGSRRSTRTARASMPAPDLLRAQSKSDLAGQSSLTLMRELATAVVRALSDLKVSAMAAT